MTERTLLLLRHAQAADKPPGGHDHDRPLTPQGQEQAAEVGRHLAGAGAVVDHVLCSSALRTRQTLEALALDADVDVEFLDQLYNAGADEIIGLIRELAPEVTGVLVIGHAPGIPSVAYELADPATSSEPAAAAIEHRFPAATLATLLVRDSWADLSDVALVDARLP